MASLKLFTRGRLFQSQFATNGIFLKALPWATYAKKIGGPEVKTKGAKGGPSMEKKRLPVEKDTHRLVSYLCGSNVLKEGGEDVKIKEDGEYPDWLWQLRLDGAVSLDQLDPNTLDYWLVLRNRARKRGRVQRIWKRF